MIYHSPREVLETRRKGVSLSAVIDDLLKTPRVWEEHLTPFSLIQDLQKGDHVDMTTPTWWALPVDRQIELAKGYQWWYAHRCGLSDIYRIFTDRVEIKMVLIPPMRYLMGPDQKVVLVEKPFWMGEHEVTQEQWRSVMGNNPSHFRGYANLPVDQVSWHECQSFCRKTKTKLPTEEQWELACRAGTTTRYSFGNNPDLLKAYGWYWDNSGEHPHLVTVLGANAFGLYDMHGNVWEWCQSKYPSLTITRVFRGGSWINIASDCTSEYRDWGIPSRRDFLLGFRVARSFHP